METSIQNYAASAQTLQAKQAEHQAQVDAALEELNRLVTARTQLGWWDKIERSGKLTLPCPQHKPWKCSTSPRTTRVFP